MYKLVVLLSVVAVAVAKPSVVAPLAYSAVVPGTSSLSSYSTSVLHGSPYHAAPAVYSAPLVAPVLPAYSVLAQPPHSPAVVLDAVNGVPLDTPEVVAARAAHYQARALSGLHHLHKRSVGPVVYSSPLVSGYSTPLVSAYPAGHVVSPFSYSSVYPRALSVHPY